MDQPKIRNFCIIAHIDHGKSTLADRMLEITKTVPVRKMREQFLDKLAIERERGITIKLQAVRMLYSLPDPLKKTLHFELLPPSDLALLRDCTLNLIDTPGHVDFSYEVSRSLAACEGAVLLVDATQGIQAQTLSNFLKARKAGLAVIPAINKIDLPNAEIEKVKDEIANSFGFQESQILQISAKTGQGVEKLLDEIVKRVPPPAGQVDLPLRALVFDSFYDEHKGVVALIRVVDGGLKARSKVLLMNAGVEFEPVEIGYITAELVSTEQLVAGEVGYLATGIKDIKEVRVGDTIGKIEDLKPLPGYQEPQALVFANLYPIDQGEYQKFRQSLERLSLNDASVTLEPISSLALGFGFRAGFLGFLHLSIVVERLQQEFGIEAIVTRPTIDYQDNKEPYVLVKIFTPLRYLGPILQLCQKRRSLQKEVRSFGNQIELILEMPLVEVIVDFHDQIKSLSSGFASWEYEFLEYRPADLARVKILINQREIEELSFTTIHTRAESEARFLLQRLKSILPVQQFKVPLQAAIDGKIIAREDIPARRKDVTAKLYGGDRTRKDKLLKKQKEGKKKLKKFGKIEIPIKTFKLLLDSTS